MSIFKGIFGKGEDEPTSPDNENTPDTRGGVEIEKITQLLQPFKRTTYIPKVNAVKPSFNTKSKIGGLPYLISEEDWPLCPNCKKQMTLFLQLNLANLPDRISAGLAQLFYCTTDTPLCESDLEAYFPFSKAVVCRRVETSGKSASVKPKATQIFEEKEIIGWDAKDDYPHFEEYASLGINLDIDDRLFDLIDQHHLRPLSGDKLFGWPYWVQGKENPADRTTGTEMELLFQLDSEVNLPFMFGDMGVGHVTQSPDNEDELAFGWACS